MTWLHPQRPEEISSFDFGSLPFDERTTVYRTVPTPSPTPSLSKVSQVTPGRSLVGASHRSSNGNSRSTLPLRP